MFNTDRQNKLNPKVIAASIFLFSVFKCEKDATFIGLKINHITKSHVKYDILIPFSLSFKDRNLSIFTARKRSFGQGNVFTTVGGGLHSGGSASGGLHSGGSASGGLHSGGSASGGLHSGKVCIYLHQISRDTLNERAVRILHYCINCSFALVDRFEFYDFPTKINVWLAQRQSTLSLSLSSVKQSRGKTFPRCYLLIGLMASLHYSHNLGPSKLKSIGFDGCGWQLHAKHFELIANSQHYTQYLDRKIQDLLLSIHSILANDDFLFFVHK